jgi:hypothetical protein
MGLLGTAFATAAVNRGWGIGQRRLQQRYPGSQLPSLGMKEAALGSLVLFGARKLLGRRRARHVVY